MSPLAPMLIIDSEHHGAIVLQSDAPSLRSICFLELDRGRDTDAALLAPAVDNRIPGQWRCENDAFFARIVDDHQSMCVKSV
jgi:hypothetical protein